MRRTSFRPPKIYFHLFLSKNELIGHFSGLFFIEQMQRNEVKLTPEQLKAQAYASRRYVARLRREILEFYGAVCAVCGFDTNLDALQIDHIYGGGNVERKRGIHSRQVYRDILVGKRSKRDFQVLCANCNTIKRITEYRRKYPV